MITNNERYLRSRLGIQAKDIQEPYKLILDDPVLTRCDICGYFSKDNAGEECKYCDGIMAEVSEDEWLPYE